MRLTELYCIQCGDVAAERLHREDGDLVADISGGRARAVVSRVGMFGRSNLSLGRELRDTHPETTLASCQHASLSFSYVCACMCGWADVGVGRLCSWEEEGASPYMTGNSEDASLWDWQIGWHPLCDLANAAHGKSKSGRVAAGSDSRCRRCCWRAHVPRPVRGIAHHKRSVVYPRQFYRQWNWQVIKLFQKMEDQATRAMSRPVSVSPASWLLEISYDTAKACRTHTKKCPAV